MSKVELKVDSSSLMRLIGNLAAAQGIVLEASVEGMTEVMDSVYERAWELCPVFNGFLQSSMYKELEVEGDEINVHVGHGGNYNVLNTVTNKWTDDYAVEVHESYKISAANRARGASWKWLEKAMNELGPDFESILSEIISGVLTGSMG